MTKYLPLLLYFVQIFIEINAGNIKKGSCALCESLLTPTPVVDPYSLEPES